MFKFKNQKNQELPKITSTNSIFRFWKLAVISAFGDHGKKPQLAATRFRFTGAPSTVRIQGISDVHLPRNLSFSQGKFDVTEFVGSVSEKLIADSKADNGRMSSFYPRRPIS